MLKRKMLRDIKISKTQFLSISLMAFFAIYLFSGIGSVWYTMQTAVEKFYYEANLSNIWLYGNAFTEGDIDKLKHISGISDAELRLVLEGTAELEEDPEVNIILNDTDNQSISKCIVLNGMSYDPTLDGIWINDKFAETRSLVIGDSLTFSVNGYSFNKKILGIMISPEYVYACASFDSIANPKNIGIIYAGTNLLPAEVPVNFNQIVITTNSNNVESLESEIEDRLEDHYNVFLSQSDLPSNQQIMEEIEQTRALGYLFPFVFVAVALLTILTTMTRIVNAQRVQIGTLKSLGYKDSKIMLHYISYGAIPAGAGAIVGLLLGPKTITPLFYDMLISVYSFPDIEIRIFPHAALIALFTVIACTCVTFIACKKILNEIPAMTLRPKPPKISKHMWVEYTSLWKKMGFSFQWNFRDALRSKVRSIMAIVGIMGCMGLLTCAFGMLDTMNDVNSWKYEELVAYRNMIPLTSDLTASDINYTGELIQEESIEIEVNGMKKTTGITILDNDSELTLYTDTTRQLIKLPTNGVSISYRMAQTLGINVGDTVRWHIYGNNKWVTSIIKAIYRDPVSQGITVYRSYFEKSGNIFEPSAFLTQKNLDISKYDYIIWNVDKLKSSVNEMMSIMYTTIYLLIFMAVIMAVVVLYNLGVLSFTEKQREFATLKVLGFSSTKIRKLLLSQNIWLSIIGIVPGYLIGKGIIDLMCTMLGDDFDMMTRISYKSILLSIFITLLTSIIVNIMFSKRIKNIDMVSALKGVE